MSAPTLDPPVAPPPAAARNRLRWFAENPLVTVCTAVVLLVLVGSFALPLPYDPEGVDATAVLQPPSATHLMGTDQNGSDVFSRVVAAGRTDLTLAIVATLVATTAGVVAGLLASKRNRVAGAVMNVLDLVQSFPLLLFSVILVSLAGNNLGAVVAAIVVIGFPSITRLVRSEALVVRELRYVEVAESIGVSSARTTFRHVLPNVAGVITAQFGIMLGRSLMIIATLAFIGVGVTAPTPSWGAMVRAGANVIGNGVWWVAVFPGLAVVLVMFCVNLAADGVQRSLGRQR
ncbi:ABC transporter permease [Pseudonocardia sp. NPDC049635]|uniref:ABC transporter permease n=1 Tax=Pseudonocardia sp. NPDC049635 TaxID=3155506 RepID=UPI003401EC1B